MALLNCTLIYIEYQFKLQASIPNITRWAAVFRGGVMKLFVKSFKSCRMNKLSVLTKLMATVVPEDKLSRTEIISWMLRAMLLLSKNSCSVLLPI